MALATDDSIASPSLNSGKSFVPVSRELYSEDSPSASTTKIVSISLDLPSKMSSNVSSGIHPLVISVDSCNAFPEIEFYSCP